MKYKHNDMEALEKELQKCELRLEENEFYLIKAPNGKVLEIKNFNTENGAAIRLWDYAGHPWQQWQTGIRIVYTSGNHTASEAFGD